MKFTPQASLILLAIIFSCNQQKKKIAEVKPPNIILVFADDLGYDDLGCYGQKIIQTPHIDRMAEKGMKLTDFYSASPVCAPSRCSLLTGKHAGTSYIRSNLNQLPLGQYPIPDEEVTIAELLKEKHYNTAAMGKWSLGSPFNAGDPILQGFDHFFGYYCQCNAHNYYPEMIWNDKDTVKLPNETVPVKVGFIDYPLSYSTKKEVYSSDLIFDEALSFIDQNKDNPFFLYYATALPHSNGEAPEDEKFEIPDWGIYADSAWSPMEKGYASMVTMLDKQVGQILEKLKAHNIDDNTLVIFTSDNGPTKFAKRFYKDFPFKGRKRDLYEGGIRVPLVAYWPNRIQAGTINHTPAATYDFMATFNELAEIETPASSNGKSMLPILLENKYDTDRMLYWDFYEGDRTPKQAVRHGDWKLLRFQFDQPEAAQVELYNLTDDPGESKNLASQHPDKVSELIAIMDAEHSDYTLKHLEPK